MRTPKTLLPLILALAALPFAAQRGAATAGAWASNPQSRVQLITPWKVAPSSGDLRLGLHFTLAPGWHVYWKNSGDAGFPPIVTFAKTPGLGATELLWPAPERFELRGGLVALGYEKEVVYPVRAALTGVPGHVLRLSADVDYLVCEVDCIPYRYTLTAEQPVGASAVPDLETAPLLDAWWNRLPAAADALPGVTTDGMLEPPAADNPGGSPVLVVRVHGAQPAANSDVKPGLFLEVHDSFDAGRPEARVTGDGVVYRVPLKPHEAGKPLPPETTFAWTATGLVVGGQARGQAPVSLEARRSVRLGAVQASSQTATRAGRPALGVLAGPVPGALLAVAATLAALWLWGLVGRLRPGTGKEALGFAAAAVICGTLWALSRQVSFVGLAAVELILIAMALCAWLRRRMDRRRTLSVLLALGLAACAAAAPWLAWHNRLTPPPSTDAPKENH
jgi:DsbC/DsbD-like thiol-disulfide interchange protein